MVSRRKRAAPDDLYRSCRLGGDCIPDVVQKFEHKTPADQILKWGSAAIYLGGLGIGTGSGAAGVRPGLGLPTENIPLETLGPRDLPAETSVQSTRRPSTFGRGFGTRIDSLTRGGRPSAPRTDVDVGVSSINPGDPSVITPETVPPNSGIDGVAEVGGDAEDVQLLFGSAETNSEEVAVLEVPAGESVNRNTRVSQAGGRVSTAYHIHETSVLVGETSETAHVLIGGDSVGGTAGEEIELDILSGPRTSSPAERPVTRPRGISNLFSKRYYTQVELNDTDFLLQPAEYVASNVFENPAFEEDPEESLVFPNVTSRPVTGVDSRFLDLVRLGRVQYTRSPGGTAGVSRVGSTFSIQTRSGLNIGRQVHYRFPLSPITETENIELDTFSTPGPDDTEPVLVDSAEDAFLDSSPTEVDNQSLPSSVPTVDLLDDTEPFTFGQLTFRDNATSTEHVSLPDNSVVLKPGGFPEDSIINPISDAGTTVVLPGTHPETQIPDIIVNIDTWVGSFFLHPSLTQKKRKRTNWYFF